MSASQTATPAEQRSHPLHWFMGRLHAVLDEIDSQSAWSLSEGELAESVKEYFAAQARLTEIGMALVAQADASDLASLDGAVNTAAWLRDQVQLAPTEARRQVAFARSLADHELTRRAMATGSLSASHAVVVVGAVEGLPRAVEPELRATAEAHLIEQAASHHPRDLRTIAAHLIDVVDPSAADERIAAELERIEAKAGRETFFDIWHDEATGMTEFHGKTRLLQGIKLARIFDALSNQDRPDPIDREGLTASEVRGRAFGELIDRLPLNILPALGRNNATVVVTMTLESLLGGLAAAAFDTGYAMSASLARRLAAESGVIPAVLGSKSEVLDLGRKVRLFSKQQRLAMKVQQGGRCGADSCDRPATWAEANHLAQWTRDHGPTDLANGILLCKRHHTLADHNDYVVERISPAQIRIRRR